MITLFLIFYAHGGENERMEINVRLFIAFCDITPFWFTSELLKENPELQSWSSQNEIQSKCNFTEDWIFIEKKKKEN